MKKTIWALHGFFGLPEDWSLLEKKLSDDENSFNCEDLSNYFIEGKNPSLADAAKIFCEKVSREQKENSSSENILLGYSMGGRLALHVLISEPHLFSKAIIASAHPGLEGKLEITERRINDEIWADKFINKSWDELLMEWNGQKVFLEDRFNKREEKDFNREILSQMMQEWSLAKQDSLWERLKNNKVPVLWLVGENDEKFCGIADRMELLSENIKVCKIKDTGHRVFSTGKPKIDNEVSQLVCGFCIDTR